MNTNQMAQQGMPIPGAPCVGSGCGAPVVGDYPIPSQPARVPSLEEIASFNYLSPEQQRIAQEQIAAVGRQAPRYRTISETPARPQYAQIPPIIGNTPMQGMGMQGSAMQGSAMQGSGMQGGMPAQGMSGGAQPSELAPITPMTQPMPVTAESLQYMNGFLRTQVGRLVRVEFLIGTNMLVDREGVLLGVGANYILLNEVESDDLLVCDFYNIKFIKFYY